MEPPPVDWSVHLVKWWWQRWGTTAEQEISLPLFKGCFGGWFTGCSDILKTREQKVLFCEFSTTAGLVAQSNEGPWARKCPNPGATFPTSAFSWAGPSGESAGRREPWMPRRWGVDGLPPSASTPRSPPRPSRAGCWWTLSPARGPRWRTQPSNIKADLSFQLLGRVEVCKDENVGDVVDGEPGTQGLLTHHFQSLQGIPVICCWGCLFQKS